MNSITMDTDDISFKCRHALQLINEIIDKNEPEQYTVCGSLTKVRFPSDADHYIQSDKRVVVDLLVLTEYCNYDTMIIDQDTIIVLDRYHSNLRAKLH